MNGSRAFFVQERCSFSIVAKGLGGGNLIKRKIYGSR